MRLGWAGYIIVVMGLAMALRFYMTSRRWGLRCLTGRSGTTFCARDRPRVGSSFETLSDVHLNLQTLVNRCQEKYPTRSNVIRMVSNYKGTEISEILPSSEHVAYSENKGEKIALCLDKEKAGGKSVDNNTLMFVAIHELAHVATEEIGHTPAFWDNFRFLLKEAVDCGIYRPQDYSIEPVRYCGTFITSNPYY